MEEEQTERPPPPSPPQSLLAPPSSAPLLSPAPSQAPLSSPLSAPSPPSPPSPLLGAPTEEEPLEPESGEAPGVSVADADEEPLDTVTPAEALPQPPPFSDEESEALRLKTLAEAEYSSASLKSALKHAKKAQRLRSSLAGISQMVTALRVLRSPATDHYRTLLLEPFSHINAIKKQYKNLALALHPDKNPLSFPGSDDAFKRVSDSFHVLSDRTRRSEYDLKLRIELQASEREKSVAATPVETFWTACTTCRLLHQFDRRYVGHWLVCPNCTKSFLAVEFSTNTPADEDNKDNGKAPIVSPRSARLNKVAAVIGKRKARVFGSLDCSRPKRAKEQTLAEMQMEAKRKSNLTKTNEKGKENGRVNLSERKRATQKESTGNELSTMSVEDSDFYDFDKDRMEKSFRKGQVWAIYDDDDGMPRHYGLIEEIFSVNPFKLNMSWLDLQNHGDEVLMLLEKQGFHVSCGRFKVGKNVNIYSVNLFSHLVECERAAREMYRIYPKKGSVWALYKEGTINEGDVRCYDIAIFLTSYSETYGLSMAYLEKVAGFKTIFRRQEIGIHAIKWFEKDDVRLFSHQIPARKLSSTESPDLSREYWELDPASLPPDLLRVTSEN